MDKEEDEQMTADDTVNQWIFDYYFDKCVSLFNEGATELDSMGMQILQSLLQSVDPDDANNRMKGNILLLLQHQMQLVQLDLTDFPWTNVPDNILQSKSRTKDFLAVLESIQTSLTDLDEVDNSFTELSHKCHMRTLTLMLQTGHYLKQSASPIYNMDKIDKSMEYVLQIMTDKMTVENQNDLDLVNDCESLVNGDPDANYNRLPSPIDLPVTLAELVGEIYSKYKSQPQLLKMATSFLKLEKKFSGSGDKDLFSKRTSSVEDLVRLKKKRMVTVSPQKQDKSERDMDIEEDSSDTESTAEENSTTKAGKRLPQPRFTKKPTSHAVLKQRKQWTTQEEEKFIKSVLKIGLGKWAETKEDMDSERTSVQLKDKWRNIPQSRVRAVAKEYGLSLDKLKKK